MKSEAEKIEQALANIGRRVILSRLFAKKNRMADRKLLNLIRIARDNDTVGSLRDQTQEILDLHFTEVDIQAEVIKRYL